MDDTPLTAAEEKERDTASKKEIKTIEVAADQASKNEVMTARMLEYQGNLTAVVYKQVYEENQKQLKLTEVSELWGITLTVRFRLEISSTKLGRKCSSR